MNRPNLTPFEMGLLFWYFYSLQPYPENCRSATKAENRLTTLGLLESANPSDTLEHGGRFRVSKLGNFYVAMLRATPLPETKEVFVDPRTNEVIK